MANPKSDFPPVRACLFDMDGLIIDSEDKYTICTNAVLAKYGRPPLPWSIKSQLQGRPGPESGAIFHAWAGLPISREEYMAELAARQRDIFPSCRALPGVADLLAHLATATTVKKTAGGGGSGGGGDKVHVALASSTTTTNFELKTAHLEPLFAVFAADRRVLGDDPRIPAGRGKPLPDIYLLALEAVNAGLAPGEAPITPLECLVFEDSVLGVEAGRRAGMRVAWVPHPELAKEYKGREALVLAGLSGEGGQEDLHQLGQIDDGWAHHLTSLENFPYGLFGIVP